MKKDPKDRLPIEYIALSGIIASLPTSLIAVKIILFRDLFSTQE